MNIDIIAPASAITPDEVNLIRNVLSGWGLTPHIPDGLLGKDLLCANNDELRFQQLQNALFNDTSDIIWCVRGGYGCTRLLPKLAKLSPPARKKLLIGCSDVTALHIFLQQQWGWPTLHAAGAKQAALGKIAETDIKILKDFLTHSVSTLHYSLLPLNVAAQQQATSINSTIIGGNLCLIQASIGTFWQIKTHQKILFLEEVNERGYRIDRMLEHLRQAGIFDGLSALLLGDFIGGEEPSGQSLITPVLERFAANCSYPVLRCPGIGHGFENHPLPLGMSAALTLSTHCDLRVDHQ